MAAASVLGFDSSALPTSAGPCGLTLFHYAGAAAQRAPAFWCLYLGSGGDAATPATTATADAVARWGAAIVVVWNDADEALLAGGWAGGVSGANQAVAQARALGVPPGTAIWCDVESEWTLTAGFADGWTCTLLQAGFVPGFYGCLSAPGFAQGFLAAYAADAGNLGRCLLWAATPEPGYTAGEALPAWAPDAPSAETAGLVVLWQVAEKAYGGRVDVDLARGDWAAGGPGWWGAKAG